MKYAPRMGQLALAAATGRGVAGNHHRSSRPMVLKIGQLEP